jgi:DNA polymerase-3 subunit beta
MIVSIDRDDLEAALSTLRKVVEGRTTIPILNNVLISVRSGTLALTATNLDIEARVLVGRAEIQEESATHSITAPADTLSGIASRAHAGKPVVFEWADDTASDLIVKTGRSKSSVRTLPAIEFPTRDAGEPVCSFEVAGEDMADMLERVAFAAADENRPELCGIYMHTTMNASDDLVLRTVAADGIRLAMCERPCPDGAARLPAVLMSRKTVDVVSGLIAKADAVTVGVNDRHTFWEIDNRIRIIAARLNYEFPAHYERIIPKGNRFFTVDAGEFRTAVERALILAQDSKTGRAVSFSFSPESVVVSARSFDAGSIEDEVSGELEGEPFSVDFNGKHMLEAVAAADTDTLRLEMQAYTATNAGGSVIRAVGASDAWILMPLKPRLAPA